MHRILIILLVAGLVLPFVSGCSGVATTAGHRYAQMDVKAQWVDGVPEFVGDRPGGADRTVTVRVRNPPPPCPARSQHGGGRLDGDQ